MFYDRRKIKAIELKKIPHSVSHKKNRIVQIFQAGGSECSPLLKIMKLKLETE